MSKTLKEKFDYILENPTEKSRYDLPEYLEFVHDLEQLKKENQELKAKVRELIQYTQDFNNHGRNYNLIFRTIEELKSWQNELSETIDN